MIKERIKEFITNPAFISLVIWSIIAFFIPPLFTKYMIKHTANEYCLPNTYFYYFDLDSDGTSELISVDLNDDFQSKIIVEKDNRILNQYDLKYHPFSGNLVYTGDYDEDGFLECYFFTISSDSIFLNIFEPVKSRKILVADRFIDFRRKAPNSEDTPNIVPAGMAERQGGKIKDFVFYINTGYSRQPRSFYRYMIGEDSLIKSPVSGAAITGCRMFDINRDNSPEILLNTLATGNLDEDFPFSDQRSWLMLLDNNMAFSFPPVKLTEDPARSQTIPINLGDRNGIVLFNDYLGSENRESSFYLFDPNGNLLEKKPAGDFERGFSDILPNEGDNFSTFYFLKNRKEILEMDRSFNTVKTIPIPELGNTEKNIRTDLDMDGKMEYVFKSIDKKKFVILQHNLNFPLTIESERSLVADYSITSVLKKGRKPQFYVQYTDLGSYYEYQKNPLYFLKYPFYFILYLSILLFIIMLSRIQKYRLNLKLRREHKIAGLQMRAIKNQIDPHFTLNVLNAIGSLYATEENRERADYIFGKYAKLIRETVISSDQIIVTLAGEIDFVKNYIDIERFRMNNSFNSNICINKDVDMQMKIPRMLIHTFVENGIKYGIRNRAEGGILDISIRRDTNKCIITIEDNGPGLQNSGKDSYGTGKGILILKELIDLYYRLEKVKINYLLENITDAKNVVAGTRAIVEVYFRINKE